MNEEQIKSAIEKLLNSMGKKMAKDYYGLDLNFTVENITGQSQHAKFFGNYPMDSSEKIYIYTVDVNTDKTIPSVLDVVIHPDFSYGKYSTYTDLQGNLNYLSRYLGYTFYVDLVNKEDYLEMNYEDVPPYVLNPDAEIISDKFNFKEYYPFDDNGTILHKKTGYVYPLFINNNIDIDEGYHIAYIENDEWWDALSSEDKGVLNALYSTK